MYEQLQFKDVPVKTFHMEYIQKRYKYANVPFPERNSYTIHITSDANSCSNMNMNITNMTNVNVNNSENILMQNAQTRSCQSENMLCPGCGRMTFCQNKSNIQTMSQNCENVNMNLIQAQNNIQSTEAEQNIQMSENMALQQSACTCHNCHQCPGCGRMTLSENKSNVQTVSQNYESVNMNISQTQNNIQSSEVEQNIASAQQEECICPDCRKCPGCGRMTSSEKKSSVIQEENIITNGEQNIQIQEDEQQEQYEQNVDEQQVQQIQQEECICPDCKKNEVEAA